MTNRSLMRLRRRSRLLLLAMLLVVLGPNPAMAESLQPPTQVDTALSIETTTPVKHLVTIMQSNHTYDSLFGAYPGGDGVPSGVCLSPDPDMPSKNDCVAPFVLENNGADFDHSHNTFVNQYRDGRNDGFIYSFRRRGEDGTLAMGHYTESDIPFSYNVADQYVLFDRFFTSASAGSVPNRMYWMTGTPGITSFEHATIPKDGWGDLPTIFDELQKKGVSWKLYVENYDPAINFRNRGVGGTYAQVNWAPLLTFSRFVDNPELSQHIVNLDQYFVDVENNQLPAVSYVVTIGSSGHPPSSLLASERMLKDMVSSLMMSPAWDTSVIQWAYDDWGGWYDHVPPPQVDEYGYGFRTAAQLVSPYARQGYIDAETHDFTSILRFIEDNWSVPSLATRDQNATSIATALDFNQAPRAPQLLSMSRDTTSLAIPNRTGIHISYSIAILSAGLIIATSFFSRHGRRVVRRIGRKGRRS
ncbi:MAG: alkaline phosphatase family protein [Thermomicrobiales bacterium]